MIIALSLANQFSSSLRTDPTLLSDAIEDQTLCMVKKEMKK